MSELMEALGMSELELESDNAATDDTIVESNVQPQEIQEQQVGSSESEKTPEQISTQTDNFDSVYEALLSTIVPLTELEDQIIALIYGDPKTRKTVSSCASEYKTLVVNIERGAVSLQNHPNLVYRNDHEEYIKIMNYKNYGQLWALAEALNKGYFPEHKVILLDTWSELQKYDLDTVMEKNVVKAKQAGKIKDTDMPEGEDYNPNTERMRRLAVAFRDTGRHIIFVCHTREKKDRKGNILQIGPDLSPKLAGTMFGMCHVIGFQSAEVTNQGVTSYLQTQPDTTVIAGTRIGGLPLKIANPKFQDIVNANKLMKQKLREAASNDTATGN